MTTIKFLGYDLEILSVSATEVMGKTVIEVSILYIGKIKRFKRVKSNPTLLATNNILISLYNLIAADIEEEMTEWMNTFF